MKLALTLLLMSSLLAGCATSTTTESKIGSTIPTRVDEGGITPPSSPEISPSTSTYRLQKQGENIHRHVSKSVEKTSAKALDTMKNDGDEIRYQFEKSMSQIDTELHNLPPEDIRPQAHVDVKSDNTSLQQFKQRQTELSERFYKIEPKADVAWKDVRGEWNQISRGIQALLHDIRIQQQFTTAEARQEQTRS